MSAPPPPPEHCANCGAVIPHHARACPECGADERSGWREASVYDGLDLPDSTFVDDAGEQAATAAGRPVPAKWYWLAGGLLVLIVLILAALRL